MGRGVPCEGAEDRAGVGAVHTEGPTEKQAESLTDTYPRPQITLAGGVPPFIKHGPHPSGAVDLDGL